MKRQKKPHNSQKRHSPLRRIKWYLRSKWRWFKGLSWQKKTLFISVPVLLIVLVIPLLSFLYFSMTMGDMETLMNRNNTGIVLKDQKGEVFYSTGTAKHRNIVPLSDISPYAQKAVIASEDKNFYEHSGVSILSTFRAVYGYVFSRGGSFGGSTITQQLAKMTLLSSERSVLRQYQAFSVALAIERRYSKDEILEMYLNSVYFGNNSFGIEQASRNYFDKNPIDLSLAESAMLTGLLPAPSTYSPITGDREKAVKRQTEVLDRMVRGGVISQADKESALSEELVYQPPAVIKNDAPHFTEMVLEELYEKYGEETVGRSGYQVTTTLDLGLQRQAIENINNRISYINGMGGSNASLVAIDPKSGEIRALVGSADYNNEVWGKVNMVTTKRQPGSTFKPLYYASALADGEITPATIIRDEAINIDGYQPQNATRRFYGDVTVRQALARSLNIPAVKVMQLYGIENSINAAKRFGITTLDKDPSDYGLALAIGAAEVPLLEMTNAYSAFADGGNVRQTATIRGIRDKLDRIIFTNNSGKARQAISPQGAYLISDILADQNSRSFMFGSSLNISGKTVAVKTGTTDENRDAWTIGYTPDIAIGVWVGNNNNDVMVSGGADMAGPIWRETMRLAIGGTAPVFTRPNGVVERFVCYGSGAISSAWGTNTYIEIFLETAIPNATCNSIPVKSEQPVEEETEKNSPDKDHDESEEINDQTEEPAPDNQESASTTPSGPSRGLTVPASPRVSPLLQR